MFKKHGVTKDNHASIEDRKHFPMRVKYDRRKLPASNSRAVSGLERKYQEMLGEIKKLDSAEYEWVGVAGFDLAEKYFGVRMNHLHSLLAALERSIRMFDPKWKRKDLMIPKVTKLGRPLFPLGTFQGILVQVLRGASEPLLVKDIVAQIAALTGLPTVRRDQTQRLWQMAYCCLRTNYERGRVACFGSPTKWFAVS